MKVKRDVRVRVRALVLATRVSALISVPKIICVELFQML